MSKNSVTSLRRTGLPVKAFLVLVARVAALLPAPGRGRPWSLLLDNRVLLAVTAWRINLTNRQLADLFGVGVATVHRIPDRLTPLIAGLLDLPDKHRSDLRVVDGTLIPMHDQTRTAKWKNHRRSVNIQFTFRARDRRIPQRTRGHHQPQQEQGVREAAGTGRTRSRPTQGLPSLTPAPPTRRHDQLDQPRRGRTPQPQDRLRMNYGSSLST
ncbi:transposase family protein [Streptomyces acidiscabies]|uniref:transposase family protein n=1 Tax=Streptomyces acidiscabies TaxID=42234 RepID=UPI00131DBB03|nr:transposase family protein [Streptomyces acidiscabies]